MIDQPEPHQYVSSKGVHPCKVCGRGRLAGCHYEEPRTPEERDRAMMLDIRRAFLAGAKAIERRFDLTD